MSKTLTYDDAVKIWRMSMNGEHQQDIAAHLGVNQGRVSEVLADCRPQQVQAAADMSDAAAIDNTPPTRAQRRLSMATNDLVEAVREHAESADALREAEVFERDALSAVRRAAEELDAARRDVEAEADE